MNLFSSYAAEKTPRRPIKGKPYAGGVLAPSPLEAKMQERQALSRLYRTWRRQQVKETLASEPRLRDFLRYLRTVTIDKGGELLEALESCGWLRGASRDVRVFALRMIGARCDKLNQGIGNESLDDPIPPETSTYFQARALLYPGGKA